MKIVENALSAISRKSNTDFLRWYLKKHKIFWSRNSLVFLEAKWRSRFHATLGNSGSIFTILQTYYIVQDIHSLWCSWASYKNDKLIEKFKHHILRSFSPTLSMLKAALSVKKFQKKSEKKIKMSPGLIPLESTCNFHIISIVFFLII